MSEFSEFCTDNGIINNKLSCRKETVRLLRGSVLATYNWETIFSGHYRSIFNHCDVVGLQSYRIRGKIMQNKDYYAVQGHSRTPLSVPIERPYATFYL